MSPSPRPSPRLGVLMIHPRGRAPYIESATREWISSAGIDIVPIPTHITKTEALAFIKSIDGLYLHPGDPGSYKGLDDTIRTANILLEFAVLENKHNRYFPVWGTCMGFQLMMLFFEPSLKLEQLDAVDRHHPLRTRSRTRSRLPLHKLTHVPWYNHQMGISVEQMNRLEAKTKSSFRILATARDRTGKEYVALAETTDSIGPMYGCQFHPETKAHQNATRWMMEFFRDEMLYES